MVDFTATRERDSHYYPTIVIGLGGTGVSAVQTTLLYGERGRTGKPAFDPGLSNALKKGVIQTIAVDTDRKSLFDERPVPKGAFPSAAQAYFQSGQLKGEFPDLPAPVHVSRKKIETAVALARAYARDKNKISQDVDPPGGFLTGKKIRPFLPTPHALYDT